MNGSNPPENPPSRRTGTMYCRQRNLYLLNGQLIIGAHVDDLLGIAPTESDLDQAEKSAQNHIKLEKRGKPLRMLGIELTWKKDEVILIQQALVESMSKKFLQNPTKRSLLLDVLNYEAKTLDDPPTDQKQYKLLIGELLFIRRMTRSEISLHINLLGRRVTNPSERNLRTALQVLPYLMSTAPEGIIIKKPKEAKLSLEIYADASYGGEGARSQTGILMTLGNQPVGWYSRRQNIVALSITDAKYIADCEGAKDAAWEEQFLRELHRSLEPTILKTDSKGAYNLSQTSKFPRRSRHIEH